MQTPSWASTPGAPSTAPSSPLFHPRLLCPLSLPRPTPRRAAARRGAAASPAPEVPWQRGHVLRGHDRRLLQRPRPHREGGVPMRGLVGVWGRLGGKWEGSRLTRHGLGGPEEPEIRRPSSLLSACSRFGFNASPSHGRLLRLSPARAQVEPSEEQKEARAAAEAEAVAAEEAAAKANPKQKEALQAAADEARAKADAFAAAMPDLPEWPAAAPSGPAPQQGESESASGGGDDPGRGRGRGRRAGRGRARITHLPSGRRGGRSKLVRRMRIRGRGAGRGGEEGCVPPGCEVMERLELAQLREEACTRGEGVGGGAGLTLGSGISEVSLKPRHESAAAAPQSFPSSVLHSPLSLCLSPSCFSHTGILSRTEGSLALHP